MMTLTSVSTAVYDTPGTPASDSMKMCWQGILETMLNDITRIHVGAHLSPDNVVNEL